MSEFSAQIKEENIVSDSLEVEKFHENSEAGDLSLPSIILPSFSENDVQYACLGAGCYWGTEHFFRYIFNNQNLKDGRILEGRVGFMSTNPYLGASPSEVSASPDDSLSSDSLLIIPSFNSSSSNVPFIPPTYDSIKKDNNRNNYIEVFCFKFIGNNDYYKKIIKFFFQIHDPTTKNQQNNDKGVKYGSTIFYYNSKQKNVCEKLKKELQNHIIKNNKKSSKDKNSEESATKSLDYKNTFITTRIMKRTKFFKAHEEHQEYLTKNEEGYCSHRLRFSEWPVEEEQGEEQEEEEEEEEEVIEDNELDF